MILVIPMTQDMGILPWWRHDHGMCTVLLYLCHSQFTLVRMVFWMIGCHRHQLALTALWSPLRVWKGWDAWNQFLRKNAWSLTWLSGLVSQLVSQSPSLFFSLGCCVRLPGLVFVDPFDVFFPTEGHEVGFQNFNTALLEKKLVGRMVTFQGLLRTQLSWAAVQYLRSPSVHRFWQVFFPRFHWFLF